MASPTKIGTNSTGSVNNEATGTFTVAHTVPTTGSNRALIVCVFGNNDTQTGVTYAGTAMTDIVDHVTSVNTGYRRVWYLANPTTGANNIVVSHTGTTDLGVGAITLQDCVQSAPLDASGNTTTASGTSLSQAITTLVNSSLVFHFTNTGGGSSGFTQGSGQTAEINFAQANGYQMNIGTAPKDPSGAITMSLSWTTANIADLMAFGIKYLAPTTTGSRLLALMGVGK